MISIELQRSFVEIALRRRCSPVNLLYIFRVPIPKNTSGGLLLENAIVNYKQREEKIFS